MVLSLFPLLDDITGATTRLPFEIEELASIRAQLRANCPPVPGEGFSRKRILVAVNLVLIVAAAVWWFVRRRQSMGA